MSCWRISGAAGSVSAAWWPSSATEVAQAWAIIGPLTLRPRRAASVGAP